MQIFVKTLTGKNITLEVEPSDNLNKLKEMIRDREGLEFNNSVVLVYGGKDLFRTLKSRDESGLITLSELNVQNESILHVCIRETHGA